MKSKLFSSIVLVFSLITFQLKGQLKESREKAISAQLKNPTWTFKAIVDTAQLTFFNLEDSVLTEGEQEGESEGVKDKFCVWYDFWKNRVFYPGGNPEGDISAALQNMSTLSKNTSTQCLGNFMLEGPKVQPNNLCSMGLVSTVGASKSSSSVLYAGTNHAGYFKSINSGATWKNITDALGIWDMAAHDISVLETDPNHLIIGGSAGVVGANGFILESADGGTSWQIPTFSGGTPLINDLQFCKFDRTSQATFIGFGNQIFRRAGTNPSNQFVLVNSNVPSGDKIIEIEFLPGNANYVFATVRDSSNYLIYSTDFGLNWQNLLLPSIIGPSPIIAIDVCNVDANSIYAFCFSGTDYVICKANISNLANWTVNSQSAGAIDNSIGGLWAGMGIGWGGRYFEMSDFISGQFVIGNLELARGNWNFTQMPTFQSIWSYYPMNGPGPVNVNTHADIRNIFVHNNGTSETLFIGDDGGINKSTDFGTTWTTLNGTGQNNNEYLNVSQYYGVKSCQGSDILYASPQDNSVQKKVGNTWTNIPNWIGVGESYWLEIDYTNDEHVFYTDGFGQIMQSFNGGGSEIALTSYNNAYTQLSVGGGKRYDQDPTKPGVLWSGTWQNSFSYSLNISANQMQVSNMNFTSFSIYDQVDHLLVAPTNSAVAYEIHSGPNANGKRLFKSSKVGSSVVWNDITANVATALTSLGVTTPWSGSIVKVVFDPFDENRVFLAYSWLWGPKLVLKSTNGGQSWSSISTGLPNGMINDLVYQNGSIDVMFAATEYGVYRFNGSVWECFNGGLPPCQVRNIDINYCRKKVYVSTYGRGAYSADLPQVPTYSLTVTKVQSITGSNVLNLEKYYNQAFANSISVENGVIVNLKGIIRFDPTSSFIIKKGARVNLTGTLTTMCGDLWRGVQVEGTVSQGPAYSGQFYTNQGYLNISSPGTIENADIGVITCTYAANGQDVWATRGGVIFANQANFINNRKDVAFLYYNFPNASRFVNCVFETKSTLKNNVIPEGHVSMHAVRNITFEGCDFKYSGGGYSQSNRGYGISSLDANYAVVGRCISSNWPCTNFDRSTFSGLTRGIISTAVNPLNTAKVSESDFNGIIYDGAFFKVLDNVDVRNCTFNFVLNSGTNRSAIYLDGCRKYIIAKNTINGQGNQDYGISAWRSNNPNVNDGSIHQIYQNTISGCVTGVAANQTNADYSRFGLKIRCNNFGPTVPNAYDVTVQGSSTAWVDRNQGISASYPVNNWYNAICYNANRWYITPSVPNTIANKVNHANASSLGNYMVFPPCSNPPLFPFNIGTYNGATCPVLNQTGTNNSSNLSSARQTYNSAVLNENQTIDAGNTAALLAIVQSTNSVNSIDSALSIHSPYLSDTVLKSYFGKSGVTNASLLKIHNLNKPVTDVVWDLLISKSWTTAELDTLNLHQDSAKISGREMLEFSQKIAFSDLSSEYSIKLSNLWSDTVGVSLDSVVATLNLSPFVDSKCLKIASQISLGSTISESEIYALHGGVEHTDKNCLLYAIQTQLPDSLRDWKSYSTDSVLRSKLKNLANSGEDALKAQALLEFLNGQFPVGVYFVPGQTGNRLSQSQPDSETNFNLIHVDLDGGFIEILPNPADELLTFRLNGVDPKRSKYMYKIFNSAGQIVEENILSDFEQTIHVNNLINGIYSISLLKGEKILFSKKIIIAH